MHFDNLLYINTLQEQIIKRIGDRFGPLSLRIAMSSSQSLTISGTKTDDDKYC
ncbi:MULTISPECIES: DinI-like family protein [Providencia]|uniref:DinI-like family protein n=1 Tax=Providencia TaxID=586 RepID=UPI00300DD7DD